MQEWATSQNIALPHRENRANAAIMYKEEEEAPAPQTNILTVRSLTLVFLYLSSTARAAANCWQAEQPLITAVLAI